MTVGVRTVNLAEALEWSPGLNTFTSVQIEEVASSILFSHMHMAEPKRRIQFMKHLTELAVQCPPSREDTECGNDQEFHC